MAINRLNAGNQPRNYDILLLIATIGNKIVDTLTFLTPSNSMLSVFPLLISPICPLPPPPKKKNCF